MNCGEGISEQNQTFRERCENKIYDFEGQGGFRNYYGQIVNKRVLDVGCGTGNLGKFLREKGNDCYGITISEQEGTRAKEKLNNVIVADIENLMVLPFPKSFFDVVIFADVLEHLKNPLAVLERIKPYLKPSASIIVSLPNVGNFKVRFGLLSGTFEYEPYGILDHTHLRFFTLETAQRLIACAGFQIEKIKYTNWSWTVPKLFSHYEWEIKTRLTRWWPGLFATQFVIYASLDPKNLGR